MRNLFVGDLWTDCSTDELHRSCSVVTENDAQLSPSTHTTKQDNHREQTSSPACNLARSVQPTRQAAGENRFTRISLQLTSPSCRRRARATRCFTSVATYADRILRVWETSHRRRSTVDYTRRLTCRSEIFWRAEFGIMFQNEVPQFLEIPEFRYNAVRG